MLKEIKDTIRKLFISKAAGPDRILNKAIKTVLEAVAILLTNTAITCLLKGNLLKCYKDIIIVILQKANKKDYFLLGSYRPIALENTLGKILKKIVAECMQEAIKV